MIAVATFYVSVWLKNKLLTMLGGADLIKATFVRSKYQSFWNEWLDFCVDDEHMWITLKNFRIDHSSQ